MALGWWVANGNPVLLWEVAGERQRLHFGYKIPKLGTLLPGSKWQHLHKCVPTARPPVPQLWSVHCEVHTPCSIPELPDYMTTHRPVPHTCFRHNFVTGAGAYCTRDNAAPFALGLQRKGLQPSGRSGGLKPTCVPHVAAQGGQTNGRVL